MGMSVVHISGTASINAGEVNVIGQNTTWLSSGLLAGDTFWAAGLIVRILSIQDNTHMTLASPWPGASRTAAQYEIWRTPDVDRMGETQRQFLDKLAGNLFSLADIDSDVDQMPIFIGKGVVGSQSLKSVARQFLAANFMPVQQGGGTGQNNNKVKLGWDGARLKAMIDALDLGGIWTDSLSAINFTTPGRAKLPNGLIIQWGYATVNGDATLYFPSTFPTLCAAVVATPQTTIGGTETLSVCVRDVAAGSFVGQVRKTSGGVVSGATSFILFVAVGF